MKIKVLDATPDQLDVMVAKANGWITYPTFSINRGLMIKNPFGELLKCPDWTTDFKFCDRIIWYIIIYFNKYYLTFI